ncbi:RDD family protein [Stomatohabitans albus]|uniref:RDD family protein n=1 Tax=Stomatohabitans albus TaxID=3110766 RepID=UPI00300D76D2
MQPSPQYLDHQIITSEAVLLDIYPAAFPTRALARIIDAMFATVLLGFLLVVAVALYTVWEYFSLPTWITVVFVLFAVFCVYYLYHILFNLKGGRTPGKMLTGLQILNRDGSPASPRQYIIREFIAIAECVMFLGFPAIISSINSPVEQRLGDRAANTIVVHTRRKAFHGTALAVDWPIPPGMEPFIEGIDVSGLGTEEIGVIRAYLIRRSRFIPQAKERLAKQLRAMVLQRITGYIPTDVPDDVLLATIMAKVTGPTPLNRNVDPAFGRHVART